MYRINEIRRTFVGYCPRAGGTGCAFRPGGDAAALGNYVRPEIREDNGLDIRDGRHPVVEQMLHGERYVPNDITFEPGEAIRVITGPNMSGKSTYLRQAALIALMAQMGSFRAGKRCHTGAGGPNFYTYRRTG